MPECTVLGDAQRKLIDWMAYRIHLVYLPLYSPELNLIEIFWCEIKYRWLPLTAYSSFDKLCEAVKKMYAMVMALITQ